MQHLNTYDVECDFATRDGLGNCKRPMSLFLPHEIFATLFTLDLGLFYQTFGTDAERTAYWTSLDEPWWTPAHPAYARVMADPAKAVPLRTHGDDGAFKKGLARLSMLVFTIAGVVSNCGTRDSILLVFGLLLERLLDHTMEQVLHAACWSLDILATGTWPSTDHLRAPLTGARSERNGALAGGYFAICTQHLGDWKYVKDVFRFGRHYGAARCCHFCLCSKRLGPGNFANFTSAGIAWSEHNRTTTLDYMGTFPPGAVPHLARTWGFHLHMLLVDFMHSDLQGVGCWLLANALLEMAEEGRFGLHAGPWKTRLSKALSVAYRSFAAFCKGHFLDHSQKRFKPALLSMSSQADWPEFRGKAHNCLVVLTWLAALVRENPSPDNRGKLRGACLLAHHRYHEVMRTAGPHFTVRQAGQFHEAGLMMLRSFSLLSRTAHLHHRARWQLKPKHHHLWHGFHHAKESRTNPRSHWLFKHEDFIGLAAALGKHIHPASLSRQLLRTWALHWAMAVPERANAQHRKRRMRTSFARRLRARR